MQMTYRLTLKGARAKRTRMMNQARINKSYARAAGVFTSTNYSWDVQQARRANRQIVKLLKAVQS